MQICWVSLIQNYFIHVWTLVEITPFDLHIETLWCLEKCETEETSK